MLNQIYQFIWFKILKPVIKKSPYDERNPIKSKERRMLAALRLASLFPGKKLILCGDSNKGVFKTYDIMKQFRHVIVVNIAIGGTIAHDWNIFFKTKKGQKVKRYLNKWNTVFSMGGNYVLKDLMSMAYSGMSTLKLEVPGSFCENVPFIKTKILDKLDDGLVNNRNLKIWNEQVKQINSIIRMVWEPFVINIRDLLRDPYQDTECYWWSLQDTVHFSDVTQNIYVKIVNFILERLKDMDRL